MKNPIVTIDGPAGSGKSTIARLIARELKLPYIDTGAMYRAVGYLAKQRGLPLDDEERLCPLGEALDFKFESKEDEFKIYVRDAGKDFQPLGPEVRTPEVSMAASQVALHPKLREILVRKQQECGKREGGVLEGRDAGTVIFPESDYKFFVTASPEVRAGRRHEELVRRSGDQAPSYDQVLSEVTTRDRQDQEREASPLRPAQDAELVDTSNLEIQEVFDILLSKIRGS